LFICTKEKKEVVQKVIKESNVSVKLLVFDEDAETILLKSVENENDYFPSAMIDSEKVPIFIVNTSGTTGNPKAVQISHAYLISQGLRNISFQAKCDEVVLFLSPPSWVSFLLSLFEYVVAGCTQLMAPRILLPFETAEAINRYKVTAYFSNTNLVIELVNYLQSSGTLLKSVRSFFVGGFVLYEEIRESLKKTIPNGNVVDMYGLSETLMVMYNYHLKHNRIGIPCDRIIAKVVDDEGKRLSQNEAGELCVKTSVPILGYTDPQANVGVLDSEGFFHTGDVVKFDSEGFAIFEGRLKDLIKFRFNAYNASTLEAILSKAMGITDLCVVGLTYTAEGEPPAAAVVKPKDFKWTEKEIVDWTVENLPPHQHLVGGAYFVQELPRSTTSGKVKRFEVRKLIEELNATAKN